MTGRDGLTVKRESFTLLFTDKRSASSQEGLVGGAYDGLGVSGSSSRARIRAKTR